MKRRWSIVLAVAAVVVLGGGAGALYAYDAARSDVIANGVVVAGVDVGGLSANAARAKLDRVLVPRLQRPVTIRAGKTRIVVPPASLDFHADVDRMVQDAVDVSRNGTFVGRAFRELAGNRLHRQLPTRVAYSTPKVWALARRVRDKFNRRPADATLEATGDSVVLHPGRVGLAVKWRLVAFGLVRQLTSPTAPHVIDVPVRVQLPKITRERLAKTTPWFITINRGAFTLRLWHNLRLFKTYRIAVGQVGLETPAGLYHVENKAIDPAWHVPNSAWAGSLAGEVIPGGTPENPIKSRWLGIFDGAGIHGTDATWSLGTAASHGCIRMAIPDVIQLYDFVPVKTPVYIA